MLAFSYFSCCEIVQDFPHQAGRWPHPLRCILAVLSDVACFGSLDQAGCICESRHFNIPASSMDRLCPLSQCSGLTLMLSANHR